MPEHVIQIVGLADGRQTGASGQYVVSFDADANGGYGDAVLTPQLSDAKRFPSGASAFDYWRTQASAPNATRPDGQPNRPLTAFTVKISRLDG